MKKTSLKSFSDLHSLSELSTKCSSEKEKIEAAIQDLEAALKGTDKAEIDAKVAALSTAAQKLGEKMYADAQAQQAAAGAAGGAAGAGTSESKQKEENVVDAEFKEVNDK